MGTGPRSIHQPLRICVVATHATVGEFLTKILLDRGHEVRLTPDPLIASVRAASLSCQVTILCSWGIPFHGRRLVRSLRVIEPRTRLVLLDDATRDADMQALIRAGVTAVIGPDCTVADAVDIVEKAARGDMTVTASDGVDEPVTPSRESATLSLREEEILQLVVDGIAIPEIARLLFISHKTVKHHLSSVYSKLGVTNRTDAVVRGLRCGIVELGSGRSRIAQP